MVHFILSFFPRLPKLFDAPITAPTDMFTDVREAVAQAKHTAAKLGAKAFEVRRSDSDQVVGLWELTDNEWVQVDA